MNKFLERCKLPILTQKRTENLNRPIISNEMELVIKTLHKGKTRSRWLHWLHVCTLKQHLPNSPTRSFLLVETSSLADVFAPFPILVEPVWTQKKELFHIAYLKQIHKAKLHSHTHTQPRTYVKHIRVSETEGTLSGDQA